MHKRYLIPALALLAAFAMPALADDRRPCSVVVGVADGDKAVIGIGESDKSENGIIFNGADAGEVSVLPYSVGAFGSCGDVVIYLSNKHISNSAQWRK